MLRGRRFEIFYMHTDAYSQRDGGCRVLREERMKHYSKFDGKRVLIWGYGREGRSSERFLREFCSPAEIAVFEGKREDIDEDKYDWILKSPGIVMPEDHPKYSSQTEIFLEEFRDRVIGVTGTKGKSTTSSMIAHVLGECLEQKVILLGNIGKPCLDYYGEIDENTVIVFEMSCHQLAHVRVSPHVAVFLNLFEEHLDYYGTMERYFAAKCNIARFQTPADRFFVGAQVPAVATDAVKTVIAFGSEDNYHLQVLGEHNNYNAEFVYRIATQVYGASDEAVRASLKTFCGLPHRLQRIGEKDGVTYYDDSISTIPNATIEALAAIPGAYSVIIGGMDRGIDYSALVSFIKEHPQYRYILAYETGRRIYASVSECDWCCLVEDLEQAVATAKRLTPAGRACVLSPAAASYGYFKDFEERGEVFRALVGV